MFILSQWFYIHRHSWHLTALTAVFGLHLVCEFNVHTYFYSCLDESFDHFKQGFSLIINNFLARLLLISVTSDRLSRNAYVLIIKSLAFANYTGATWNLHPNSCPCTRFNFQHDACGSLDSSSPCFPLLLLDMEVVLSDCFVGLVSSSQRRSNNEVVQFEFKVISYLDITKYLRFCILT